MKSCFVLVTLNWSLMKGVFQHWPWTCEKLIELALGLSSLVSVFPLTFGMFAEGVTFFRESLKISQRTLRQSHARQRSARCVTDMFRMCLNVVQLHVCIIAPLKFQQVYSFHLSLQFLLVNILSIPSYLANLRQISTHCKLSFFHVCLEKSKAWVCGRSFAGIADCGLCDGTGASSIVVLPNVVCLWSRNTSTMGQPRPEERCCATGVNVFEKSKFLWAISVAAGRSRLI